VFELSLVSVPALQSARIDPSSVKSFTGEHLPARRDPLPPGLTKQQTMDLRRAEARRVLGAAANKPATYESLYVATRSLRDRDRQIAAAVVDVQERLKALEAGQSRIIDVTPDTTRAHPGSVRLIKAR